MFKQETKQELVQSREKARQPLKKVTNKSEMEVNLVQKKNIINNNRLSSYFSRPIFKGCLIPPNHRLPQQTTLERHDVQSRVGNQ